MSSIYRSRNESIHFHVSAPSLKRKRETNYLVSASTDGETKASSFDGKTHLHANAT